MKVDEFLKKNENSIVKIQALFRGNRARKLIIKPTEMYINYNKS